ncbi:4Fe-4S dicluster domain-containing protein [Corynebacterium sp. TA-R-1]|uniref:4Fe-4S dicluster domain-containing protein n=1 Tax=Corynebacterium stercoris TaxID=2943490 RepID=A0ABT1G061_9CORY|nr:4Fe-4S dicluster domain-containing protein [Corynebacterium stercoris]MCP1387419.1 4Fe-4S dicluster domain-containing protein [Corynebacterium stercoris]
MSTKNRVTEAPYHVSYDRSERKAFFTDTSICIGCKACEVACKEWNRNPQDGGYEFSGMSYDNTGSLGADTWRHVAFIEQSEAQIERAREEGAQLISLGMPGVRAADVDAATPDPASAMPHGTPDFRWLMSSDVCKHCTNAGCLDVCPTGALFRTEHGTVVVQDDVCNGCGTCVAGCPFGVIERRADGGVEKRNERSPRVGEDFTPGEVAPIKNVGVAQKCTMCFDRQAVGEGPACAKTCPTTSIKYGSYDEMLATARARVAELHAQGQTEARLYGANSEDGVGGTGSIFLLLDAPEVYGLPPDPEVPTANLPEMAKRAAVAAAGLIGAAAAAFAIGGRG